MFYARKLGMRSRNLNGLVKITFGQGVFGVMLEAEVLLLETTMAMKEVAYELGFSELSYFSTYFKRRKGMSPMEFREKSRKVEGETVMFSRIHDLNSYYPDMSILKRRY